MDIKNSNSYLCPICSQPFNDQTLYCEDWRDKDRCFGCPNCKAFFHRIQVGKADYKQYLVAILCAGLAFVCVRLMSSDWHALSTLVPIVVFALLATRARRHIRVELRVINDGADN